MSHSTNWRNKNHYSQTIKDYNKHSNQLNKLNIKKNNNIFTIMGKQVTNVLKKKNSTRKKNVN